MVVQVCGSCHLKGSEEVVELFQKAIETFQEFFKDKVIAKLTQ